MNQAKKLLVTGSSGLIGSEVADYFCLLGWDVQGLDNNMRADFFGPGGDTRWNRPRLQSLDGCSSANNKSGEIDSQS